MPLRSLSGCVFTEHFHPHSISIAGVEVQFFWWSRMGDRRCGEVLRGAICPRCRNRFYICRHCDRGHVYCCRRCSVESRREKCCGYRRLHRSSVEGREDHRNRERASRRRRKNKGKVVGDQGFEKRGESENVSTRERMVAGVAAIGSACAKEHTDEFVYCEICGCRSRWVYFGDGTTRSRNRSRVFRCSG